MFHDIIKAEDKMKMEERHKITNGLVKHFLVTQKLIKVTTRSQNKGSDWSNVH
ncbi:MAG: hypothetical protein H6578_07795 [Chitinophagales bacterium]|nr:hypothetical protein [Chitinophagales bacterium]